MSKNCAKKLRSIDTFGEPVELNYRGDSTFNTTTGAIATIFYYGLMIYFAIIKLEKLFSKNNPDTSYN